MDQPTAWVITNEECEWGYREDQGSYEILTDVIVAVALTEADAKQYKADYDGYHNKMKIKEVPLV